MFALGAIVLGATALAWWRASVELPAGAANAVAVPAASFADSAPSRQAGRVETPPASAPDAAFGRSASAEHDLWKYANAMRTSSDGGKLMEARHAILECKGFAALGPDMANFVSGGRSRLDGPVTPDRQLAYAALTSKCGGFRTASKADIQSLRNDIEARARKFAPEQFQAAFTSDFSGRQKIEMLFSGGASEIAQSLPQVATDWAVSRGLLDRKDERRDEMLTAAFLAACDLGTDCSPDGFETQLQCVLNGECQRYWQGIEDGLSDERRQRVAAYRAQLVQAVKERNLESLGLDAARMSRADRPGPVADGPND